MPKITLGIAGLHEILIRDHGLKDTIGTLLMSVNTRNEILDLKRTPHFERGKH